MQAERFNKHFDWILCHPVDFPLFSEQQCERVWNPMTTTTIVFFLYWIRISNAFYLPIQHTSETTFLSE
jgi:hypothetical protein